jgi:ribonuclease P protein component
MTPDTSCDNSERDNSDMGKPKAEVDRSSALSYPHCEARLKKRAQFLAVAAGGRKAIASTLVVQGAPANENRQPIAAVSNRVGFTVTKKAGNAVVRNRIRRRLRAAVADNIAHYGTPGWDYVVIGRNTAFDTSYDIIVRDLRYALRKVVKPSAESINNHTNNKTRKRKS